MEIWSILTPWGAAKHQESQKVEKHCSREMKIEKQLD
jgi:hypothetical protein